MARSCSIPEVLLTLCVTMGASAGIGLRIADADPNVQPPKVAGVSDDNNVPATYRLPIIETNNRTDGIRAAVRGVVAPKSDGASETAAAASLAIPPTSSELTAQLLPAVQRGHNLAQRGAFFAARTEFIQVLRRVAQAKDATAGNEVHSRQLAAGLRAMDEADDFVPRGAQLEAELNVRSVASSHRTPVLKDYYQEVMPHEAVAMYHSYAQLHLSQAALDEQAGSMALYGLGKIYGRQAERSDDDVQLIRGAMTMYAAALDSCPNNNLAANELGVLLCRTGHPAEAIKHFTRAIDIAPTATAYHNLAVAQQKLGLGPQSAANEFESQRLASIDRASGTMSRQAGIQWVSPAEMANFSQAAPPASAVQPVATAQPANGQPQPRR